MCGLLSFRESDRLEGVREQCVYLLSDLVIRYVLIVLMR